MEISPLESEELRWIKKLLEQKRKVKKQAGKNLLTELPEIT